MGIRIELLMVQKYVELCRNASLAAPGQSVTDFSVQTVLAGANELLADQRIFELDENAWKEFTNRLDAPPASIQQLRELSEKPSLFDSSAFPRQHH
jgi:uncharacterized protein (DUF1778 family)